MLYTGEVLADALVTGAAVPSKPTRKAVTKNCRNCANLRFLFISSSIFLAGEGSGRGRPAAIPWPGARVSNKDMGYP